MKSEEFADPSGHHLLEWSRSIQILLACVSQKIPQVDSVTLSRGFLNALELAMLSQSSKGMINKSRVKWGQIFCYLVFFQSQVLFLGLWNYLKLQYPWDWPSPWRKCWMQLQIRPSWQIVASFCRSYPEPSLWRLGWENHNPCSVSKALQTPKVFEKQNLDEVTLVQVMAIGWSGGSIASPNHSCSLRGAPVLMPHHWGLEGRNL